MGIDIADELRVIGITPILRRVLPRNAALNLHTVKLLVEHEGFELFVVLQDERNVV